MKLFIWNEPYLVAYGSSLVFAVADTLEEARKAAMVGISYRYGDCPGGHVQNMTLGEPTRIVEIPCAEWHEWSEYE